MERHGESIKSWIETMHIIRGSGYNTHSLFKIFKMDLNAQGAWHSLNTERNMVRVIDNVL